MSFGFSPSDFVLLVQLAHKTFRNCQIAGPEYVEISREVRSLHSVLRTLRTEAQRPDSIIFKQGSAPKTELLEAVNGCKDVLDKLDSALAKYERLDIGSNARPERKIWQRLRFGSKIEELSVIRGKLIVYTSTISVLLDTIHLNAADRIETKVESGFKKISGQFEKMRKEIYKIASHARSSDRSSSTLSLLSLSTHEGDNKDVWQDFRRELIRRGFKSGSLDRHRYVLQAYMLKLDQSGLLDQGLPAGSGELDSSPRCTRQVYINTDKSWEEAKSSDDFDQQDVSQSLENGNHGHLRFKGSTIPDGEGEATPTPKKTNVMNRTVGSLTWAWMFGSRIAPTKSRDASEDQLCEVPLDTSTDANINSNVQSSILPVLDTDTPNALDIDAKAPGLNIKSVGAGEQPISFENDLYELGHAFSQISSISPTQRPADTIPAFSSSEDLDRANDLGTTSHEDVPRDQSCHKLDHLPKRTKKQRTSSILPQRRVHYSIHPLPSSDMNRPYLIRNSQDDAFSYGTIKRTVRPESVPAYSVGGTFPAFQLGDGSANTRVGMGSFRMRGVKSYWSGTYRKQREALFQLQWESKIDNAISGTFQHIETGARIIPRIPLANKSILRRPSQSFPVDPVFRREGIAPKKVCSRGIPVTARWTKISRNLVLPEALKGGRERYEAQEDCVIVLRVLTEEEIQEYRNMTRLMKSELCLSCCLA
jgi:hypothetical protein